ncbi:MAG TPA: insulinase family protein, partial [Planctomycetota bacterium]|nr:insulinase family protein [Planctomycetota bacterium]
MILAPDHSLPRVEVNLWYRVGSKDEPLGRSGFAHLFEHLMFMGTERVPNAEFDQIMEAGGGANNATTSPDRTNYFDFGPAPMLRTLLWLEADRLESLDEAMTQEKLDLQREVVRNERRQSIENQPYGKADVLVNELMYPPGHPYQISVIGKHEDLQAATVGDVKDFFNRYYVPNNASLCVAGDFDPQQARQWIEEYFGDLPPGPEPPRAAAQPAPLDGPRRITLPDQVQLPRLSFVYHSPAWHKPGDGELDLVADVLAGGKSSRLYERLVVHDQSAVDVSAFQASGLLGSLFRIDVYAAPGSDLGAIERAVDEELDALARGGPQQSELARAVAGIETSTVSGLESLHNRADRLNSYLMLFGDPDGFERDLERYRRATPAGVAGWARSVLDPRRRLVMTVLPEEDVSGESARWSRPEAAGGPPAFAPPVPAMAKRPSGLEVWHLERGGLPLVSLSLVLPNGTIAETPAQAGLATLAASMMEEGAGELDSLAFAEALQQLGARFSVSAGLRQTVVSLTVLERHLDAALALFHDAVTRPRFEPSDFQRVQRLQIESLRQDLDD